MHLALVHIEIKIPAEEKQEKSIAIKKVDLE